MALPDFTQFYTTKLYNLDGITSSQTAGIELEDISGVDDITRPGVVCFGYRDPLAKSTSEWILYTSITATTGTRGTLNGVVRAFDNSIQALSFKKNTAVAFVVSKYHMKAMRDQIESALPYTVSDIYRQALINGNFDVWQRGTSEVRTSNGWGAYLPDRWVYSQYTTSGSNPTITYSRQAHTPGDVPGAFYFYRVSPNGAGTSLSNDSDGNTAQKIENGVRYLCGLNKQVTLSFWARSNISGKKLGVRLSQNYGTGGSPSAAETISGTNWTLTSSWTKYTYTFTTNTLVGKTFGTNNDDSLQLILAYQWGSSVQSTVGASSSESYVGSGNIDISQVSLCAGAVALPFMAKSFNEELTACMRFYEKSFPYATAPAQNAGQSTLPVRFPQILGGSTFQIPPASITYRVPKRTTPTMTCYNPSAANAQARCLDSASDWSGSSLATTDIGFYFYGTSASGSGVGMQNGFHWTADAEL